MVNGCAGRSPRWVEIPIPQGWHRLRKRSVRYRTRRCFSGYRHDPGPAASPAPPLVLFVATIIVVALVVVALLRWIDHLMGFGRMGDTLDRVEKAATKALKVRTRTPCLGGHPLLGDMPEDVIKVCADQIGYIQRPNADQCCGHHQPDALLHSRRGHAGDSHDDKSRGHPMIDIDENRKVSNETHGDRRGRDHVCNNQRPASERAEPAPIEGALHVVDRPPPLAPARPSPSSSAQWSPRRRPREDRPAAPGRRPRPALLRSPRRCPLRESFPCRRRSVAAGPLRASGRRWESCLSSRRNIRKLGPQPLAPC